MYQTSQFDDKLKRKKEISWCVLKKHRERSSITIAIEVFIQTVRSSERTFSSQKFFTTNVTNIAPKQGFFSVKGIKNFTLVIYFKCLIRILTFLLIKEF